MNSEDKRNLFLNHLAKIYIQNPNFPISKDTVYAELSTFNIENNNQKKISRVNLVPVQTALGREYPYNSWSNGYFWIFENRKGKKDKKFIEQMKKSIKLYIAVDESQIYQLSQKLFNYMLKENIMTQSKISKVMRNDALVVRVSTKEEAVKVSNYVNSLKYVDDERKIEYHPNIHPNPFSFSNKNVNISIDGNLSYNSILSSLIKDYMMEKRNNNDLENVSSDDFKLFLIKISEEIKKNNNFALKYSKGYYEDFIIILKQIIKNLNNSLTLNEILNFSDIDNNINVNVNINDTNHTDEEKQIVINIIAKLEEKYNLEEAHLRILTYFEKGNVNIFTRDYGIRKIIQERFTPVKLKEIISEIGFSALIDASYETLKKYDYNQLEYAIKILLKEIENKKSLEGFTNKNDVRSRLGFIIPELLLVEVMKSKASELGITPTAENIANMLNEYVNEKRNNKKSGRN